MEFIYGSFSVFPVMFLLVFLLIIGVFIAVLVKGISTWYKNNNSPRLTVAAKIVSKRTHVSHHTHAGAGDTTGFGKLSFQGTRYLSFERSEIFRGDNA